MSARDGAAALLSVGGALRALAVGAGADGASDARLRRDFGAGSAGGAASGAAGWPRKRRPRKDELSPVTGAGALAPIAGLENVASNPRRAKRIRRFMVRVG